MTPLVIIGGGNSISEFPELWDDIIGRDVLCVNYAYKFTKELPKWIVSIDPLFWRNIKAEINGLEQSGCKLVGKNKEYVLVNNYDPNGNLFRGRRKLSGIFALDYALRILKADIIYLFGYDFGLINGRTHFYDSPKHNGINKKSAYMNGDITHDAVNDFDNFKGNNIYIVGESHIMSFPKISYTEFKKRINE